MNQELITFILLSVFLFCAIGLLLIGLWVFEKRSSSSKQKRISRFIMQAQENKGVKPDDSANLLSGMELGKFRERVNATLRSLSSEKLKIKLSSAYWAITDTEFILVRFMGTIISFVLGWMIPGNILGGIFLAALVYMLPPFVLERAIAQRQRKFHNQLMDVLVLIQGAVQSGYSLNQSLNMAIEESAPPASIEFGRMLNEINLGLTLETALNNLSERMENDDLKIVVTAIIINAQVGGNLSTVLDSAISTIRDRMQLVGEINSLTSYARFVGFFLTMLPFITGLVIFLLSPGYFDTVKTSLLTQIIFGAALMGVFLGNIFMRKIVQIKV